MAQRTSGEIMKKLILALLMFISCSLRAEWVLIGESTDGSATIYVDPATIRRDGTLRKYWKLTDLNIRNKNGDKSWRTREEIDCKEERYRIISLTSFSDAMLGGNTSGNYNYSDNSFANIAPSTLDEDVMKYVCAK